MSHFIHRRKTAVGDTFAVGDRVTRAGGSTGTVAELQGVRLLVDWDDGPAGQPIGVLMVRKVGGSVDVKRGQRWRSNKPMRAKGDPKPAKIAEGVITKAEDGEGVFLRVTRGHGSRSGRIYLRERDDLVTNWTLIEGP